MSWVVDTCVLLDIFENDEEFAIASADALDAHANDGLCIAPVTFVELTSMRKRPFWPDWALNMNATKSTAPQKPLPRHGPPMSSANGPDTLSGVLSPMPL